MGCGSGGRVVVVGVVVGLVVWVGGLGGICGMLWGGCDFVVGWLGE